VSWSVLLNGWSAKGSAEREIARLKGSRSNRFLGRQEREIARLKASRSNRFLGRQEREVARLKGWRSIRFLGRQEREAFSRAFRLASVVDGSSGWEV